jgi:hypothetical protein
MTREDQYLILRGERASELFTHPSLVRISTALS